MALLNIIFGGILLLLGRRLFWFFVGVIGFVAGFALALRFFPEQSEWVLVIIAIIAGVLGAILAVFVQGLAVAIAGFLAGGYLAIRFLELLSWDAGDLTWLPYLLGGIIGAALVILLFNWALIILSSLVGASLIVEVIQTNPTLNVIIFVVLFIIGFVIQARMIPEGEHKHAP
jgi:MFS family permease